MKFVFTFALACVLTAISAAQSPAARQEPFVPMAVSYRAELVRNRERTASDFDAIRALGFNAIRLMVSWADVEPTRGHYRLDSIGGALELAARSDLKVILRLEVASAPPWLFDRYPDGRYVPAEGAPRAATALGCLDHPGVRADVESFVSTVTANAAPQPALYAIDVGTDLDAGFCVCPRSARRYQDWTKATFGDAPRSDAQARDDRATFVSIVRRDHLAILGAAASARGNRLLTSAARMPSVLRAPDRPAGQDDRAMAQVVDRYGVDLPPTRNRGSELSPSLMALGFDGVRAASGSKGWSVTLDDDTSAPDLRLWTWMAIARGADAVIYGDWRTSESKTPALAGSDVRAVERAQTAAAVARVIARNPALFAPLRPGRASVAMAFDDRAHAARIDWPGVYGAFFDRNIQVDIVHADQLATSHANGYALVVTAPTDPARAAALASNVSPVVKVSGASGAVETRFLESADVLMLIGLNHGDTRQRVTMTFPPDTQEAIWQNMETGAAVNFIAGANGPTYTYTFGAKDVLVLMIRKNIR